MVDPESDSIDFSPENPLRPPDWRWQRVVRGHEAWNDPWRDRLARFHPGVESTADPDLVAAASIYQGDPLHRAEVEARILAGQNDTEIGTCLGLRPELVNTYEAVFFEVRSQLRHPSYILHVVLGPKAYTSIERTDVPFLWRKHGYRFGLSSLDLLVSSVPREDLQRLGVDAYLEPDAPLSLELKFSIAGDRIPTPRNAAELTKLTMCIELALRAQQRPIHQGDILAPLSPTLTIPDTPDYMQEFIGTVRELCRDAA